MRLDIFLKLSRLIPRRPLAKRFAAAGLIEVNGRKAKASHVVAEGDSIKLIRHDRIKTVNVLKVPKDKQVSKKDAGGLYELESEEILEQDPF